MYLSGKLGLQYPRVLTGDYIDRHVQDIGRSVSSGLCLDSLFQEHIYTVHVRHCHS